MAHCNKALINAYTRTAKPESKTQQKKKEYAEAHPMTYVECSNCGAKGNTLHKAGENYFCKEHIPS